MEKPNSCDFASSTLMSRRSWLPFTGVGLILRMLKRLVRISSRNVSVQHLRAVGLAAEIS